MRHSTYVDFLNNKTSKISYCFSYKNTDIVWNLLRHRSDLVVLYPCQLHNLLPGRAPLVTPRRCPLAGSTMLTTPMTTMPTMSPTTTLPAVSTRRTITEPRHSIRSSLKRGQYRFRPPRRRPPRSTQVWDRRYYLNQYTKWVKKATPR